MHPHFLKDSLLKLEYPSVGPGQRDPFPPAVTVPRGKSWLKEDEKQSVPSIDTRYDLLGSYTEPKNFPILYPGI